MANGGRWTGSTCPVLKFCTKTNIVLSVWLNQQLQLDDLVAQCVSKDLTEAKFCRSLPVVSRALWTQFLWFYFLPFELHFCIYNLHYNRVTKLWSKVLPFRYVCTLQTNRFNYVLCRKKCGWFNVHLCSSCPAYDLKKNWLLLASRWRFSVDIPSKPVYQTPFCVTGVGIVVTSLSIPIHFNHILHILEWPPWISFELISSVSWTQLLRMSQNLASVIRDKLCYGYVVKNVWSLLTDLYFYRLTWLVGITWSG
mgnify:CR=1 FL=1